MYCGRKIYKVGHKLEEIGLRPTRERKKLQQVTERYKGTKASHENDVSRHTIASIARIYGCSARGTVHEGWMFSEVADRGIVAVQGRLYVSVVGALRVAVLRQGGGGVT